MDFDYLIFPSPKPSYSSESKNLIWLTGNEPKIKSDKAKTRKFNQYKVRTRILRKASLTEKAEKAIPCLWLPYREGSDKVIMYFHANAEDIGHSYQLTDDLRKGLCINVISIEYPGYGLYKGKANE